MPFTAKDLEQATAKDAVLSWVLRYTREGWPSEVPDTLKPYFQRRQEVSVDRGCLFRGSRLIIPIDCQEQVLSELHVGHQGIVKMKGLARSHVWWPGMDKQIENLVRSCQACQSTRNQPPVVPLHPWPWSTSPWERIHVDFAGPFLGSMFLVLVDSHSKWMEVEPMESTTTERTVEVLRALFARYGLPKCLVSDNGPQFVSKEFAEFLAANGVRHIRSAPYHPATNGAAERFVQTFKQALRAGKNDRGNVRQKLAQFLMMYRNTPHATTGVSPTELFLKRRARTRLDVMRPASIDHVYEKQMEQKGNHDKRCRPREFQVGQAVWVRNVKDGPKWLLGEVCAKTGSVSYEVCVAGQVWKRHADQMVSQTGTQLSFPDEATSMDLDISVLPPVESPTLSPEIAVPTANESERVSQETSD